MPHPHRTTTKSLWEVRPTQLINVELKTFTMNRIKSFASVALFALATTVLTVFNSGCSKDKELVPDVETAKTEMLVFKDYEEYAQAVSKTNSMTECELVEYEQSMGYKSFGRVCDEFYYSININKIKSIEDIHQMVEVNCKYLTFHTDYTGETYCLPQEFDNEARFVINEEKMYVIGNYAYKKLDRVLVSSEIQNIAQLKQIENVGEVQNNPLFKIQEIDKEKPNTSKKEQYEDHDDEWVGNKKYRIKLFIQTEIFHYTLPGKVETHRETEYRITNYLRRLGVWFQTKLYTDYEIHLISIDDRSNEERVVTTDGLNKNVYGAVHRGDDKYKQSDALTWDYKPYFSYYYAHAKNSMGCEKTFQQ